MEKPKKTKKTKKTKTPKKPKKPKNPKIPKKKRGRKPKKPPEKKINKKRGRKPKGGKIIKNIIKNNTKQEIKPNIILHLKCSLKDLNNETEILNKGYTPEVHNVESFNIENNNKYELYSYNNNDNKKAQKTQKILKKKNEVASTKLVYNKLRDLQKDLHKNNIYDKKSDCFWCTCPFDNPAIHIPARIRIKNGGDKKTEVYGCFCSPECAVGYLSREKIDSSTMWERFALLNNLYGEVFNYKNNIKPAPCPFHTLDKYYGNLTIQEYRQLLNNNHILLVVDKPLTKILPELHEENFDPTPNYMSIHNKNIKRKTLSLRRKKQSENKKNIIADKFNFH
jgi:hypothetical protein